MTKTDDHTARITELKGALQAKSADIRGLSADWKDEGGKFVIDPEKKGLFTKAVDEAEEIKGLIVAEQKAMGIEAFLDSPDGGGVASGDAVRAAQAQQGGFKSLGSRFLESKAYEAMRASGFKKFNEVFEVEGAPLHSMSVKDVHGMTAGTFEGIPAFGGGQDLGLQERVRRSTRVRDLFPVGRTTKPMLYGVRQTGFTNAARPVPQREMETVDGVAREVFGRKPKSDISMTTITYPVATIAHLLDVHKNVLDDEPRLRGILDNEMIDGVKMAEDEEILYGDGVGENLTGIFNTPGVQTYVQGQDSHASDKRTATIRRAATRAMLAEYEPTGLVLNLLDWEEVELEEDGNGGYRVAVSVAVGAQKIVWNMRVVGTTSMLENRFLLGAFGTGAKLYDREQVSVTVSTENRDNYERNVVTLRAEERIALEVPRPEAFVIGTFTDTSPPPVGP